jgi:polyisoprenoid-binding protein YceI
MSRLPWLVLLVPLDALAGPAVTGKPRVVFHATGSPGFLDIEGTTSAVTVAATGEMLVFTVPIDTVETGIALRDQHLRETYVDTKSFPDAVLALPRAGIAWPVGTTAEGTVTGQFTAHGVTRPVAVTWSLAERDGTTRVRATFPFDVSAHGIAIPSYLGVTIAPAMTAEVKLELVGVP